MAAPAWETNPHSLFDVSGRVAIITGASGAFGALAARVLGAAGARLVLAAGKAADLARLVGECEALGAEAIGVNVRPDTETRCDEIVAAAVARFGRLDILVVASGMNDVALINDLTPMSPAPG
jgi:NAD(P)-dependent dehydrogenase (short-subunit alcohol dehydrogenase family)